MRCEACGAATTDPWPSDADLERAYARYRPESGRFSGAGDALLRRTRSRLARRIDRIAPQGRVLDVGAGDGTLLDALAATGRQALGLERDVRRADMREAEVTNVDGEWSAIVFWHSLEHLRDPRCLDRPLLQPPLSAGSADRSPCPTPPVSRPRTFGDRWFHLDLPRHLVHLPAQALVERLSHRGLQRPRGSATGEAARRCSAGCTASWALYRAGPTCMTPSAGLKRVASRLRPAGALWRWPRARRCSPSPRWPPRSRWLRAGAARCTWRRSVTSRPPGKVIVVMPAMNAARTLEQTVEAIPSEWVDEVVARGRRLERRNARTGPAPAAEGGLASAQRGYAPQKTCYLEALQRDADAVVMLHPDGQYEPELIGEHGGADPRRAKPTSCSARVWRLPGMALANGMPRWKYPGEQGPDQGGEPNHGDAPLRSPPRATGPTRAVCCSTVPFLRNSSDFSLRFGTPDAGRLLRDADP